MNNITREDIADFINNEFGLTKKDCNNIVKDLTTQYKRLGPSEGARILSETNIEEKENNEDELIR